MSEWVSERGREEEGKREGRGTVYIERVCVREGWNR